MPFDGVIRGRRMKTTNFTAKFRDGSGFRAVDIGRRASPFAILGVLAAVCAAPAAAEPRSSKLALPRPAHICVESHLASSPPLPDNFQERMVGRAILRWFARYGDGGIEIAEAFPGAPCKATDLVIETRTRLDRQHDTYAIDFTARAGGTVYADRVHRRHVMAWGAQRGPAPDGPGPVDPWWPAVRAGLALDTWALTERFYKTLGPPTR